LSTDTPAHSAQLTQQKIFKSAILNFPPTSQEFLEAVRWSSRTW
jgi:hypothetical protein